MERRERIREGERVHVSRRAGDFGNLSSNFPVKLRGARFFLPSLNFSAKINED